MTQVLCGDHDIVWDTEAAPGCPQCLAQPDPTTPISGGSIRLVAGTASGTGAGGAVTITGGTGGLAISGIETRNLVIVTDGGVERFRIDRDGNIYTNGRLAATDLEVRNAARVFVGLPPLDMPDPERPDPVPGRSRFEIIEDEA